jgi:hypothetical protein
VQVLEDQQERLLLRFAQQQLLKRIKRAAAPLRRIEYLPCHVVQEHIEQGQQRRQGWLQSAVEREQLARHLLPDLAELILVLDFEVTPEKVDHRQVAHGLSIGDRGALENQPALQVVRMGELPEET